MQGMRDRRQSRRVLGIAERADRHHQRQQREGRLRYLVAGTVVVHGAATAWVAHIQLSSVKEAMSMVVRVASGWLETVDGALVNCARPGRDVGARPEWPA